MVLYNINVFTDVLVVVVLISAVLWPWRRSEISACAVVTAYEEEPEAQSKAPKRTQAGLFRYSFIICRMALMAGSRLSKILKTDQMPVDATCRESGRAFMRSVQECTERNKNSSFFFNSNSAP